MRLRSHVNQIKGIIRPELKAPVEIFFNYETSASVDAQGRTWTKTGTGTFALSTAQVRSGTHSVQSTASTTGSYQFTDNNFATNVGNCTYDFWFYSTTVTQNSNTFIDYRRTTTDSGGIWIGTRNNDLSLWNYIEGYFWTYPNFYTVNEWVRTTVVRDNGVLRIYRNGVLVGTTPYTRAFASNKFSLYGRFEAISGNWFSSIGFVDNMRIYPRNCRYYSDFDPLYDI